MNTLEGVSMEMPMKCKSLSTCTVCGMAYDKGNGAGVCIDRLAAEAQRLRDERETNPGVWDGAPSWADHGYCVWYNENEEIKSSDIITRTLPKTIEQEIAENVAPLIVDCENIDKAKKVVRSILAEYKERTK
jgi:hypothetical protein